MCSNNYTCKISIVGSDSVCVLNSEWKIDVINILLLHNNQAWSGIFQIEDNAYLSELIDQLSITKDKYMQETKNALTSGLNETCFVYTLDENMFTWKKYVKENMTVKFGNITLSKCSVFSTFERIIDNILHTSTKVTEQLQISEEVNNSLVEENKSLQSKLSNLVEEKSKMERTLYSQFLSILNEKKKKIEELEENIDAKDNNTGFRENNSQDVDANCSVEKVQLSSKTNRVTNSLIPEEDLCNLPKRSKKQKRINHKSVLVNSNMKKEVNNRKSNNITESCVMEKQIVKDNTEDVFMFPEHSRDENIQNVIVSSTNKVNNENDIDINLGNSSKSDSDVLKMKTFDLFSDEDPMPNISRNKTLLNNSRDTDDDCKEFSSSTLDMLNQLI